MKGIGKIAVCVAGGLACSFTLRADGLATANAPAGNPYTPIVERNVFGLLPPPPPPDPNAAAAADAPKITVNGIMNVFGNLQVLFKTPPVKGASKANYYDLAQGQSEDNIEVVSIDEKGGTVTFQNNGVQQQIALADESSGGGGGGSGGGGGGMSGGFNGGGNPGFNGGYNGGGGFGNGNRFPHPGGYSGGNNGFNNGGSSYGGGDNGGGATPSVGGFTFGTRIQPSAPPAPEYFSQITPEQQAIMMEVNRVATQDQVNQGTLPPLPPTPITPDDATGVGGAPLVAPPPPVPDGQ